MDAHHPERTESLTDGGGVGYVPLGGFSAGMKSVDRLADVAKRGG